MSNTNSRIPRWVVDWALIVGLVVLAVTFVNYGMSLFYAAPEYDDFCGDDSARYSVAAPVSELVTEDSCVSEGGKWTSFDEPRAVPARVGEKSTTTVSGTCDRDFYCRQNYEDARDLYDRNGLIIMLIVGLAISVLGFRREKNDIISSAFSISGVIVILSGLLRFWPENQDWAQFILLGSLLAAFLYLAIKRR